MKWIVVLILSVAVGGFFAFRLAMRNSLERAACIELRESVNRWMDAKAPTGDDLREFMRGRRADLVFTNRSVTVDGSDYLTQFALTRLKSGRDGVLYVT